VSTKLEFDVLANDRASSKLDKMSQAFGRFGTIGRNVGNKTAGAFGRIGSSVAGAAKLGVAGIAVLGAGLVAAAPKVFGMAANLELMGKKAKTVFGSEIGNVEKWAKANANAMGLTSREATGLASGFADLLIPMGFTRKQAAAMATDTVGLSGALAEWSGGTLKAAEVSDILSAAFLGERDGLQALGISISQAEVDAELLAKGQDKLTGKALQQAEALATQKLIMEKSTDAQKAFANGGDSLARKMEVSKAKVKEMAQELLVKATPAMTKIADLVAKHVLPALQRFADWLGGPGMHVMASWALAGTEAVLGFGEKVLDGLDTLLGGIQDWGKWMLRSMAATFAVFNPGLAKSMLDAANDVDKWAKSSRESVQNARNKLRDWNADVSKMKTEVKLKADIANWETQLKKAKIQVTDKALTAERRAHLRATITDLETKIRNAKTQLGQPSLTATKIAKLQADKSVLDSRLTAAKTALASPSLTATKRAQLTANITSLQKQVNAAQAKINSLRGKTVTLTTIIRQQTATGGGHAPEKFAHGGRAKAGVPIIVGDGGRPELFVPDQDGTILPRVPSMSGGMTAAGGGSDLGTVRFELALDGKTIQTKLLKLKRTNGGLALGLA